MSYFSKTVLKLVVLMVLVVLGSSCASHVPGARGGGHKKYKAVPCPCENEGKSRR